MFIEHTPNLGHDFTFCASPTCPIKECGRHRKHHPKGTPVSIADFEPVCRSYMFTVVKEVQ